MLDKRTFMKGMAMLGAAFDKEVTEELTSTYWEFLKDFQTEDFKKVVKNHISLKKWFPKIAELREELVYLSGFDRPTGTQVWDSLLRAAESGKKPEMDGNTERALAVCGGWDAFQFMPYHDLQFRRKDFERVYNEGLERQDRQLKLGEDKSERLRIAGQGRIENK